MPWWSLHSADPTVTEYEAMRRRFVEASRRAEIIAMVNEADSEAEVTSAVAAELCEAFEAEVAFVLIAEARYELPRFLGCLGLTPQQQARVLSDPVLATVLESSDAGAYSGGDLLGVGGRAATMAPFHAS